MKRDKEFDKLLQKYNNLLNEKDYYRLHYRKNIMKEIEKKTKHLNSLQREYRKFIDGLDHHIDNSFEFVNAVKIIDKTEMKIKKLFEEIDEMYKTYEEVR